MLTICFLLGTVIDSKNLHVIATAPWLWTTALPPYSQWQDDYIGQWSKQVKGSKPAQKYSFERVKNDLIELVYKCRRIAKYVLNVAMCLT